MNAADRHARLMGYRPQLPAAEANAVREIVVALVEEVDFTSMASDLAMIKHLYRLVTITTREYGSFVPELHLAEAALASYAHRHLKHASGRSRGTILSSLRRVRNGRTLVPANARVTTSTPFAPAEMDMINHAVSECITWRTEGELLLTLAHHAALRSEEIVHAEGSWVGREYGQVWVRVPRSTGEFRRIPVFGEHAERLLAARRTGEYLLRPNFAKRGDAISSLKALIVKERRDFAHFTVPRARNTRILELMAAPAPWPIVTAFAGLTGGQTHFVGDMVQFLGSASEAETWAYLANFEGAN